MRRKKRRRHHYRKPEFSVSQILAWADDFHQRVGSWPLPRSGRIVGSLGETWRVVEHALYTGYRGLPGGSSLARLLAEHRGRRNLAALPDLAVPRILGWADAYHARTGCWPNVLSGRISGTRGESWNGVEHALRKGARGLSKSTLARLLAKYRGKRNLAALPRLTVPAILAWAEDHRRRSGRWPTEKAGQVFGSAGETWTGISLALQRGTRGLPGNSSLAQLLAGHRRVRNRLALAGLTVTQILAWADSHYRRTGEWPTRASGSVAGAPGETWSQLDNALRRGSRKLPGGSSLARLLARRRGLRNPADLPALTIGRILAWADAYHETHGAWPKSHSGPVAGTNAESWRNIHMALWRGYRGLRGGSSLPRLLARYRGVRNLLAQPPLSEAKVLAWADAHQRRTGRWPGKDSGLVPGSGGVTWTAVNLAFRFSRRGLTGPTTLARFLSEHRGIPHPEDLPRLTIGQILRWARTHYQQTGHWPRRTSGPIFGGHAETWSAVDSALKNGRRGLPGGSSLPRLLAENHRRR